MANDNAQNDRAKLYALIDEVRIAMLTTVEADGSLHTRPMASQGSDEEGNLWFFTDRSESVVKNVGANPQVGLGFSDPHGDDYVAISGTGSIVDDRAKIDEKWNDLLKAWFPKGKDDPDLVLLRVDPTRGEFWDAKSSFLTTVVGFVKAKLGGGPADDLVDTGKVAL